MVDQLKQGDILLVRGMELHRKRREPLRRFVSAAISALTCSEYTHAAMYIGDGMIVDVDIGRRVMQRPLADLDCYDVYRATGLNDMDRQRAVYFCLAQRYRRYDYTAALAIAVQRLIGPVLGATDDPHRWYCSELVARALRLSSAPWLVTPGDLASSARVEKVEEPHEAA